MKTLYAIIAFCLVSFTASAQKITIKDISGKWQMAGIGREGAIADFETGKMNVTEEWKKANPGVSVEELEKKMQEQSILASMSLDITPEGNLALYMMGQLAEEGPLTLTEKDGKSILSADAMNGDEVEVTLKDGKMHWAIQGEDMIMIFKRQE